MRNLIIKISQVSLFAVALLLSSCNDFLNEIPKGQKTPKTWADYNNFLRFENSDMYSAEIGQVYLLMNDVYRNTSQLNTPLVRANFNWDETIDRYPESTTDYYLYVNNYTGVFYGNLIIDDASKMTECTEQQRKMIVAQARVLRAMCYHHAANYHADQYCQETLDKLSIPLVAHSSVESSSPQVTIKELYDFIIEDATQALDDLPERGETMFHASKTTGYGLLARVHLSMNDYAKALEYADLALKQNNALFDWIAYYNEEKARFDDPTDYSTACKEVALENPENYMFRYGNHLDWTGVAGNGMGLTLERAARFEAGDTRLLTHWKKRFNTTSQEDMYYAIHGEMKNAGGILSPEMYYIKAECLARKGTPADIKAAMDLLNTVRKTRILPEFYQDATASTAKEAVNKIIADKANEFIQTLIPFCDRRRLNKEPEYATTLTKTSGGNTLTLKPDSHLWIMPFAERVIANPGNGTLVQNTPK